MTNLKSIEWHGGSSAHTERRPAQSQRELVAASLLRRGGSVRRWDERTRSDYLDRR